MWKAACIGILLATAAGGWWFREDAARLYRRAEAMGNPYPAPDAAAYATLKTELARWQKDLGAKHRAAETKHEREEIERQARGLLEETLPAMMRCWLGTPWDFNGTAETPGGGKIACGYFVATVLRDAGFSLDRYALARQPSSNILQSFLPRSACELKVGVPFDAWSAAFRNNRPGIYLTGLDTHVAFIELRGGAIRFLHSSSARPHCVVDQPVAEADVLARSEWRMTGNLTADPAVIRKWLRREKFPVKK